MDFTSSRSFELRFNIPKFTKAMLLRLLYLPMQTDSSCSGNLHSHWSLLLAHTQILKFRNFVIKHKIIELK